ncbi:MAG TPA: heavy metal-associated domain-containing protein [Ruminiclostridium sp.]
MKKVLKLEYLGCANCAAKMERAINKIDGVNSATVNFITQKLIVESEEQGFEDIIKSIQKVIKKIEPACTIKM